MSEYSTIISNIIKADVAFPLLRQGSMATPTQLEPFGEWSTERTKARIAFIIEEGVQGSPEDIRASLPQTYDTLIVGDAAPTEGLSLSPLSADDSSTVPLAAILAASLGRATLLNFGSYT